MLMIIQADLIDKIIDGTLILIVVFGAIHWIYNMRAIKKASLALSSIEAKGYKWATKPWHVKNTYIAAKKVNVTNVGHFPDGTILYKADTGEKFFWKADIPYIVVDIFGHIHISDDKAFLAIDDPSLIFCLDARPGVHIIKNRKEASDFLDFYQNFMKYKKPGYPFKTEFVWDAEPLDEEQLTAICLASQSNKKG